MEFWRWATNPWGQEVLVGIAWDLMWAALIVGLAFVMGHALYAWKLAPKPSGEEDVGKSIAGIPERVLRHRMSARMLHWLMSVAMFALLITAFFPLVGIRFPWVTIHWIAGVTLLVLVVYHIIHASFWEDLKSMWIGREDIREGTQGVKRFFGRSGAPPLKAGKYPVDHKVYHHTVAVVTTLAIATGLFMMFRVDTPFWARNPYLLSDQVWGVVYVVHGLSGVALITLVMTHVYFSVRPEKWWITLSMINGWIGRKEYLAHHDPNRWAVPKQTPPELAGVGGSSGPSEGAPQDKQTVS